MIKRLTSGVAAAALVMGGMALFGALSAGATSTPTISITPNTGLTNGQTVQVTGSGFAPNLGVGSTAAVECIGTANTTAGCDVVHYSLVTSDANGNVSFSFTVETGTVGNGTCGTSAADATCLITVGTVSPPATLAYATITFASGTPAPFVHASPNTDLTNGASVTVTGSDFTPGDSVYAVECLATATTAAGCDTATATPITVAADGTLPATTFKVVTGTVGTGPCGTTAANLSSCVIEVANPSGADAGATPITFTAPKVVTPAPRATRSTGVAVPGKTTAITVFGSHFTAVSKVAGPRGAIVKVKGVSASKVTLSVKEAANAKKGSFTLTIHFKSGKSTTVKYSVK